MQKAKRKASKHINLENSTNSEGQRESKNGMKQLKNSKQWTNCHYYVFTYQELL